MFGNKSETPEPACTAIHLGSAVLCVDCEMIAEAAHGGCPACGSRALIQLARALGGIMGAERIARLEVLEPLEMGLVRELVDSADEMPPARM